MKRSLFILFFFLLALFSYSQDNVFVLVDVSKSVSQSDLTGARQAMTDILSGNSLSNSIISYGSLQELSSCKSKVNDRIFILKFGGKPTTLNNNFSPTVVQNIPGDVSRIINSSFPTLPTDNQTYLTLAKAKVAEYAKQSQLKDYKLYIVSDNINDNYGSNGKPDYTDYERDLVQSIGTTSNPISYANSIKVKILGSTNKDFVLEFFPKVDVSKYTLPSGGPSIITQDSTSQIQMISYSTSTKATPGKINGSTINLRWSCIHCPPAGAQYSVSISSMSGNKFRPKIPAITSQSYSITDVPDGEYRITVSGQNFSSGSGTVYVEVNSGSGAGWLIPVILLIAAGAGGYWFWNKKRQKKLDDDKINRPDDIFSSGSTGVTGTTNTGSPGYF